MIPKLNQQFIDALEQAITASDMSSLGYVGVIGSLRNDVDIVMFPSHDALIGESLIASRRILQETDRYLENAYVSACSLFCMQLETYYLSAQTMGKTGQVKVHDLFFPDKMSLITLSPEKFEQNVSKYQTTLFGDYAIIDSLVAHEQNKLEPFFVLQNSQLLHSQIPSDLLVEKTRKTIQYVNKNYATSTFIPKTLLVSDCERIVLETFHELNSRIM